MKAFLIGRLLATLTLLVLVPLAIGYALKAHHDTTTQNTTEATIDVGFYAAAPGTNGLAMPIQTSGGLYVRWRDNGTNLYADYSLDGSNWTNFYSEAVGAFITPTAYGFGGVQQASGGDQYPSIIDLMGWLETNSGSL